MKSILFFLPLLLLVSCSKLIPNPFGKGKGRSSQVSWRFVVYDSNSRVVDSTPELYYPDSGTIAILGPNVTSTIPALGQNDTVYWGRVASFYIVIGPANFGLSFGNLQIPAGGCSFNVVYNFPTLDRSGWMVQRTEAGKRINMFPQIMLNGYDGRYNDFPYPIYVDGNPYPSDFQSDFNNNTWMCGSTQGSCVLSQLP